MAAVGTVLSVAKALLSAIESPVVKEIGGALGYRSELKNLKNTVSTVSAVLHDAEAKQDHELSNEAKDWIEKLKYAVYDADDLLDEFTTLAEQKQLLEVEGGDISDEVHAFFSRFKQLGVAYTMSRGIKKVRKQLDAIARDHTQFGISLPNNEPIKRRNKESCSYVYEQNIIGREGDKKVVIDMLLDSNVEGNVSFLTIVGIGGLGKTALAQLIYNDETIKNEFPLRLWACISDQDPRYFDTTAVLCKILESATGSKHEGSELDRVQRILRKELEGKKYLLVLDDVWNEDRDECLKLGEFLMVGGMGSRIVVTTRSKKTASVIGNGRIHELQGLSKENSWRLFQRMAFDQGQADFNPDLVEIGKEIIRECANVPLAIRMVGTLLYGKSKMEWRAIQRNGLAKVRREEGDITHVLKLSYYHLNTHLKSCFTYCAIFPKDYVMNKVQMISLWTAQGFLEPLDEGQSLYDAGEGCFSILLQRCFFQDVKTDECGEIVSFKMHDLMHDVAQEVAGHEICVANSSTSKMDERTCHVFAAKRECAESSFHHIKIRTYFKGREQKSPPMDAILRNGKYLRALELQCSGMKELPCTIGTLLHLRYLDLSENGNLERLPKEITQLHNLQTLLLNSCHELKELPSDLSKLVKLSVLDIEGCDALTFMPSGMDKLTALCILPVFIVGKVNSPSQKQRVCQLKEIEALRDLKGSLAIMIYENATYVNENGKGGFLKNKEHLSDIWLWWSHDENDEEKVICDKVLAEDLQPHHNLKRLTLCGYQDVEKPSWAIDDNLKTFLPNLVSLWLVDCKGLEDLPVLGRLNFLKYLGIDKLWNLEYVENNRASSYEASTGSMTTTTTTTTKASFFPSLEELKLWNLPKLKGWWRGEAHMDEDDSSSNMLLSFPSLSLLFIWGCPHLTSMPLCPSIKQLDLKSFNERLRILKKNTETETETKTKTETGYLTSLQLRGLRTDDARYLKSLPMQAFQCLSELIIYENNRLENLSEVEEVFRSCSSSLRTLEIRNCPKLRTLTGALEHLTALHSLSLLTDRDAPNDMSWLDEDNAIPWSALNRSLRSLHICYLPKEIQRLTTLQSLVITAIHMETLPEWISCLSSLQLLQVHCPRQLKSLPHGIRNLTSLRQLQIYNCSPDLRLRCQKPDGQDWPKIQHIPHLVIH